MTRLLPLLAAPLLLGGCVVPAPADPYYSPCKAMATRDWSAHAETAKEGRLWEADEVVLVVSGTVQVPTGGYSLSLEPGPVVRLEPPVQQVILRTIAPEGMATQALTEQRVTGSVKFDPSAKSVAIRCGDATIAHIPVIEDRRRARS